ncbi:PIG-L deacetylase family protein [Microbacterium immunditiarum]|uniref:LmbE family N-acetylglucosaminyl deacetylase n=1 Tax=Microbacterium immunditiarum TaxID=337480 RepID=A0A7Y9GLR7_9MICO|nr:PIG-L family deacetylase [Microbacterium immunditiarum]NYE18853.1 LmbE family N-acetylglucosaminyl deacetylase [Microbacterium immunditiarum]
MRKRWIALIVVASVLVVLLAGVYWAGRHLFHMPTAKGVDSVVGELDGTRVLGVFAHPDDEQTVNGLFWRAKQHDGAYTAMITATRGEAGHQTPVVARQDDLGDVRRAEALKNSFNLGVDEHEIWDYPDGGVPDVDEDELVDRVASVMKRVRPDVVVAFWPESGATGHPDHMQMGRVTELAVAQLAEEGGSYRGPDHIVYTISPTAALSIFGGEVGAFVVDNQPDPEYAMSAEVGKKHEGWAIHASQSNFLQEAYYLPAWLVYLLWDQEFYHVRDLTADPLG